MPHERRSPSGWWILPAIIFGFIEIDRDHRMARLVSRFSLSRRAEPRNNEATRRCAPGLASADALAPAIPTASPKPWNHNRLSHVRI